LTLHFILLFASMYSKTIPSVLMHYIKVIRRTALRNNPSRCLFYILYFAAACFGPRWPSSGGIHNYFRMLLHPQRIRCFVLLGSIYCICLTNTVVVYFICVCELSKLGQITSLLNVKTLKCYDIKIQMLQT
jgi:hypothetical protein